MRRLMRNALVVVGVSIAALLALGAVPSYLGSGDYYYLEATPADDEGPAVDVDGVSERRYPYLTTALTADDGRSEGYQRGPGEFKEWFAHSPFDEHDSLIQANPEAARDGGERVIVDYEETRYSVEIVRVPEEEVDD